jgi:hypothetical protein
MPTKKNVPPPQQWVPVDWQSFRGQRVLILWEVAALSLGVNPDIKSVGAIKEDPQISKAYLHRRKLLTRSMSEVPTPGLVTYFPWHLYNKRRQEPRNRMVDVVSCIDFLSNSSQVSELPEEFKALRDTLIKCPLPPDPRLPVSPGLPASGVAESPAAVKSRDQTKAIANKEVQQMAAMLFALVKYENGYEPVNPASVKASVARIEEALQEAGIKGRYGMSKAKIETALRTGYDYCQEVQ